MRAWLEPGGSGRWFYGVIKLGPDLSRWRNVYQKGKLDLVCDTRPTAQERLDARDLTAAFLRDKRIKQAA